MFIVLGDIIDKGNIEGYVSAEKYFSSLRHELKDYKIKFEFIPGNHDLVNGSLSDFDTFISKMGVSRTTTISSMRTCANGAPRRAMRIS